MFNLLHIFAGMGVTKLLMKLIPDNNYNQFDDILKVGARVTNIFAWVNQFIPTGLILILLGLTTTLLLSKMIINLIMRFLHRFS